VAGRGGAVRAVAAVRSLANGVSADVRIVSEQWTTIRFANGRITQPHHDAGTRVSVRVADERRLGTATTADLSSDGIDAVVRIARTLARVAPEAPKFAGFPREAAPRPARTAYSPATARLSPEEATRLAERILAAASEAAPGARIAGVVNVGGEELRVVNSTGLDRRSTTSVAQASVLVDRPDRDPPVSGWSEGAHWDARRLDPERLGREAAERMATEAPASVKPGAYRVVLRGPAVSELLLFLAHMGFGALGEEQGWSCLRQRRGRRLAPPNVHLVDDARSSNGIPAAIDYEGVATRRTALLDHGVVGPVVTDALSAPRLGRRPTGHALPPEAPYGEVGPMPTHLALAAGDASEDELIRSTRRGLLVTRFHYVRVVDPGRGIITGMTRDGTFRIARGEVVGPARNLRFTDSVPKALAGVEALGRELRIHGSERGGSVATCPALLTRSFRFTSATLF
jgi:PmbA protein